MRDRGDPFHAVGTTYAGIAPARPHPSDPMARSIGCYLDNRCFSDVRFALGGARGGGAVVVHAHRVVLAGASDVFRALLEPKTDGFAPASVGDEPIEVAHCEPETFRAVLRHAYGLGCEVRADSVAAVARAADYYAMPGLVRECAQRLESELLDADNAAEALLALPDDEPWAVPLRRAVLSWAVRHDGPIRDLARVSNEDVTAALLISEQHVASGPYHLAFRLAYARAAAGDVPERVVEEWGRILTTFLGTRLRLFADQAPMDKGNGLASCLVHPSTVSPGNRALCQTIAAQVVRMCDNDIYGWVHAARRDVFPSVVNAWIDGHPSAMGYPEAP